MDAHSLEPVDIQALDQVFQSVQKDSHVHLESSHWAALIKGHAKVNLNKALEIFTTISEHPTTLASLMPYPDYVVFEALLEVLVTHKRSDLYDFFIEGLGNRGVPMTTFMAACLIKGRGESGDLEKARSLFESLQDPPTDFVPPKNNYVSRQAARKGQVPAPLYRLVRCRTCIDISDV